MQTLGVITQVATLTTAGRPIAIVPSPLVTSTSLLVPVILATAGPLVPPITICPLVVRALVTWMALVALPISIPLSVRLVAPVPPNAMPTVSLVAYSAMPVSDDPSYAYLTGVLSAIIMHPFHYQCRGDSHQI